MHRRSWSFALAICLLAGTLSAQSLADVAKKEKERRKKTDKPVEVIDGHDLAQARGSGGDLQTSVSTGSNDDEGSSAPSGDLLDKLKAGAASKPSSSSNQCDGIESALTEAQRRFNDGVTVNDKVPARVARGVQTGTRIDPATGETVVVTSDVPTYKTRTKTLSCASAEGRENFKCKALQREIDSLRQELRTCTR